MKLKGKIQLYKRIKKQKEIAIKRKKIKFDIKNK